MKVELWPIEKLTPCDTNPRRNDAGVDVVARSLSAFGFRQPIVVDESGVIIVGHTRHKAALRLGLKEVPVHVAMGLTPEQARAYRIADNKTAEFSDWDEEMLQRELQSLQEAAFDLDLTGFDAAEVERLLATEEPNMEEKLSPELFAIYVECNGEEEQTRLLGKFQAEGIKCRALLG